MIKRIIVDTTLTEGFESLGLDAFRHSKEWMRSCEEFVHIFLSILFIKVATLEILKLLLSGFT